MISGSTGFHSAVLESFQSVANRLNISASDCRAAGDHRDSRVSIEELRPSNRSTFAGLSAADPFEFRSMIDEQPHTQLRCARLNPIPAAD
jgi:hypothetical protein